MSKLNGSTAIRGGAMSRTVPAPADRGWGQPPVVVGVDDSVTSRRALEWAVGEARAGGYPLRIVHALPFEHAPRHPGPEPFLQEAERRLRDLSAHARLIGGPSLPVTSHVVDGLAVPALLAESRRSSMMVLGSRGLGRFARVLLGSTAADVAARASRPVAIIPAEPDHSHRRKGIVVGVDGAPESDPALHFAFARASMRGAGLTAVHVWDVPRRGLLRRPALADAGSFRAAAERVLIRALAPWRERYPRVAVQAQLVRGVALDELARDSGDAELVVVGARRRSAWAVAAFGSVSQGLLQGAAGPVMVVRDAGRH